MDDVIANGIKVSSYLDTSDFPSNAFGLKQRRFTLGEEGDPTRPILMVTYFPPNAVLPRHNHQDIFMDAVVTGASNIAGVWHEAGTVRWFPAKAMYGPVVAGPEGLTLLEFYVDEPGFRTTLDMDALTDEMKEQLAGMGRLPQAE